ncbi:MAG: TonB-dependent receptor [Sphingobium sp.]
MAFQASRAALFAGIAALSIVPVSALAQTAAPAQPQAVGQDSGGAFDEIIVTAQKRAESIQDAPLSISALGAQALSQRNISDITNIGSLAPNLNVNSPNGNTHITIRGIGAENTQPGFEASVAFHLDGVYISRPSSTADGLYDIDRIEIVRGPQGTLYGRNATGGAVNVITAGPTDTLDGFGKVTVGNYGAVQTEGAVGGPLAEGISARIAFQTVDRDGTGTSGVEGNKTKINDRKTRAVRAKLKFEPGDTFTLLLAADYFWQSDNGGLMNWIRRGNNERPLVGTELGGVVASNTLRNSASDLAPHTWKENWGLAATAEWQISNDVTLTSVTGYRNTDYRNQWDLDQTNLTLSQLYDHEASKSFSEELRLSGNVGDRLNFVLGGYYFHEKVRSTSLAAFSNAVPAFGGVPLEDSELKQGYGIDSKLVTDALAAFGQIGFEFNDYIGIDVGARYSWERKKKPFEYYAFDLTRPFDPANDPFACPCTSTPPVGGVMPQSIMPVKDSRTAFTPKVTLRAKPKDDLLLFATYSKGFKSGGYALGTQSTEAFKPQQLSGFEAGVKADWLDRRVRTNITAFSYRFKNLQVQKIVNDPPSVAVESAGKAKLYGIEAELMVMPVDDLKLNVNAGWLRSEYVEFANVDPTLEGTSLPGQGVVSRKGNRLSQAPEYQISAGIEYTFRPDWGDLTFRGEGHFTDRIYYTPFNTVEFSQGPTEIFDLFVTFVPRDSKWTLGAFAKNITDKEYLAVATQHPVWAGGGVLGAMAEPFTFGGYAMLRF